MVKFLRETLGEVPLVLGLDLHGLEPTLQVRLNHNRFFLHVSHLLLDILYTLLYKIWVHKVDM
jgi:hypothetical protein